MYSTGEGTGNPLQCSCLENPRDGGAWSAAIYGVAQSQTRLKRLSSSSSSSVQHRELYSVLCNDLYRNQFSSFQSLICVWLFVTPCGNRIKKKYSGCMYIYNWFTLFYSRNTQHCISTILHWKLIKKKSSGSCLWLFMEYPKWAV